MSGELNFSEERFQDHILVTLSGEVDIYTSQSLKDKLYNIIDTNKCDIKLDCNGLKYIDSTGLGIFVGALKKAKQYEKRIIITGLKDNIKKLFLITGLDKIFILE